MIRFRQSLPGRSDRRGLSLTERIRQSSIQWHGVKLNSPDWSHQSRTASFTVSIDGESLHAIFNAFWEPLVFELPPPSATKAMGWRKVVDTSLPSPEDIRMPSEAPWVHAPECKVQPRSSVLLIAHSTIEEE
jgi:glycogen operon protein